MPMTNFRPGRDDFAFSNAWTITDFEWRRAQEELVRAIGRALENLPSWLGIPEEIIGAARVAGEIARVVDEILGTGVYADIDAWIDARRADIEAAVPETYGLCGGMAFAALDYFGHARVICRGDHPGHQPGGTEKGDRLREYIWQRLVDSLRDNGVRFLLWMALVHAPGAAAEALRVTFVQRQLETLCRRLDTGAPQPLGLVGDTPSPFQNHQVVAFGCHQAGDRTTIYIADSNHPGREHTIEVDQTGGGLRFVESAPSERRGALRAFFCERYTAAPPPALDSSGTGSVVNIMRWPGLNAGPDASASWEHFSALRPGLSRESHLAVAADFDGDGLDEIALAPLAQGAAGGRISILKCHGNGMRHLGHPGGDDGDLRMAPGKDLAARFLLAGNFFGERFGEPRAQLAMCADAPGTHGNDLWVMRYRPDGRFWTRLPSLQPWRPDIDASIHDVAARWGVVGDFDGDQRDEIAIAAEGPRSSGNDFWVVDFDPATQAWGPLGARPDHPIGASFDLSGEAVNARVAAVGDFDGDGRDEIAIAPHAPGSAGNDLWLMDYDPVARRWSPMTGPSGVLDASPGREGVRHLVAARLGDGRDALIILPETPGRTRALWVFQLDADQRWRRLTDIDLGDADITACALVVGDFDASGRDSVIVVPGAESALGSELVARKLDRATGRWRPLGVLEDWPGMSLRVSRRPWPVRLAVSGRFVSRRRAYLGVVLADAPW